MIDTRDHALLSPLSAKRWPCCPASARATKLKVITYATDGGVIQLGQSLLHLLAVADLQVATTATTAQLTVHADIRPVT